MVHRKINYKVVLYFFFCIGLLFSCKKEAKDPIGAKIYAVMAHNGQPVSGIKWKVVEFESKGFSGDIESTGWEKDGQTDDAGISIIEFYPKKNLNYQYDIYFDYSSMNVPGGDYSVVLGPSDFAHVTHQGPNDYDIRILPKMDVQIHYKNINCFDSNDSFKHKSINLDENPYITVQDINNLNLVANNLNQGCTDRWGGGYWHAGHYIYRWEATRGGITTSGIDTFYVAPGENNLIEMFW